MAAFDTLPVFILEAARRINVVQLVLGSALVHSGFGQICTVVQCVHTSLDIMFGGLLPKGPGNRGRMTSRIILLLLLPSQSVNHWSFINYLGHSYWQDRIKDKPTQNFTSAMLQYARRREFQYWFQYTDFQRPVSILCSPKHTFCHKVSICQSCGLRLLVFLPGFICTNRTSIFLPARWRHRHGRHFINWLSFSRYLSAQISLAEIILRCQIFVKDQFIEAIHECRTRDSAIVNTRARLCFTSLVTSMQLSHHNCTVDLLPVMTTDYEALLNEVTLKNLQNISSNFFNIYIIWKKNSINYFKILWVFGIWTLQNIGAYWSSNRQRPHKKTIQPPLLGNVSVYERIWLQH
jgi:hypothetical protein